MECNACERTVDEEAARRPNCGYSPRKTLLLNGGAYAVLTALVLFAFTPLAIDVFGIPLVPTMTGAIVLCLVTGSYGLYLVLVGDSATGGEDLDEYRGLLVE